jgi:hypothetical protein
VELEHLADTRHVDFPGIDARRVSTMTEAEELALEEELPAA